MGGGIIQHDVDRQTDGDGRVDEIQELAELDRPVPGSELMDDHAVGQVQRREQVDGAVTHVVVGVALGRVGQQRRNESRRAIFPAAWVDGGFNGESFRSGLR